MHYGSGIFGGQDYSSDPWPLYLLYFLLHVHDNKQMLSRSSSWSRHNRGVEAEADTIGEQQAEADAIGAAEADAVRE